MHCYVPYYLLINRLNIFIFYINLNSFFGINIIYPAIFCTMLNFFYVFAKERERWCVFWINRLIINLQQILSGSQKSKKNTYCWRKDTIFFNFKTFFINILQFFCRFFCYSLKQNRQQVTKLRFDKKTALLFIPGCDVCRF